MPLSADDIKSLLQLAPHPTCGFVRESYRSSHTVPAAGLPPSFDGARPLGSVLYFLVTPDAHIAMHRIRSDQLYHHYLGDPLEVFLLYADGSGAVQTVGSDLAAGMRPQRFIPGGTFHISRVQPGGDYALLGTTEWPGVAPEDVELGDYDRLVGAFMGHDVPATSGGAD